MARISIEVRNVGGESSWTEEYNCEGDYQQYAEDMIARFNATLRQNEQPRELIGVTVLNEAENDHKWQKVNTVTVSHKGRYFDKFECVRCGVTSKRHGTGEHVRDSKYKAKKYEKCRA